ncbi:hypothetical protein [Jannaschia sp. R86511]|uniref:hypothetical protein n=1 Tax=Jannaschia sp. R86511 TaxID=3093853 RepID=UPI0036D29966
MGMVSDDGLHEGWLAPVFHDGQRGIGVSGGGIPRDHIAVGPEVQGPDGTWQYPSRPAGEVTGWVIVCDCSPTSQTRTPSAWLGPVLTRVPSTALEDLAAQRVHAGDEDVMDVFHRDDVLEVVADLWRWEHLFPAGTLADVTAAAEAVSVARARLDGAVVMARHGGASWADIGRATGMTRQSAQERWRPPAPG